MAKKRMFSVGKCPGLTEGKVVCGQQWYVATCGGWDECSTAVHHAVITLAYTWPSSIYFSSIAEYLNNISQQS